MTDKTLEQEVRDELGECMFDRCEGCLETAISITASKVRAEQDKTAISSIIDSLYKLDWMDIMNKAIEGRRSSWGERPIIEWRNASDEVSTATVMAMRDHWKVIHPFRKAADDLEEFKQIREQAKADTAREILEQPFGFETRHDMVRDIQKAFEERGTTKGGAKLDRDWFLITEAMFRTKELLKKKHLPDKEDSDAL